MASITTGSDGAKRLQFRTADRRRWTIYLGTMDRRHADTFRIRVETLLNCRTTGMPIDGETARWLSEISPRYYDKLAATGLVTDKANSLTTLKHLLDTYFNTLSVKPGTRTAYLQARGRWRTGSAPLGGCGRSRRWMPTDGVGSLRMKGWPSRPSPSA